MTIETELPAVKVKALPWGTTSYGNPEAYSIVGVHRINHAGNGGWSVYVKGEALRDSDGRTNFTTIDNAKAAAQADYERRILSALTLKDDPGNGGDGEAEPFIPAVIVNDDAGISELVIADVPTVTGGEMIVRPLFDMTTCEIVGFQWDTAAIASFRKRSGADG